jgi:hypothetical protein
MPRKTSPDPYPYLRLIFGISMRKRILSTDEQMRLGVAVAIIAFIAKGMPRKSAMSSFIQEYTRKNGVSRSLCYKVKLRLEELTIIKWDEYWREYRINMERWKRDKKALNRFDSQIKEWSGHVQ